MDLADELLVQATEIRRHWSDLAVALGVESSDPAAIAGPGDGAEPAGDDVRRLVAIDMLLSGRSREEVTDHLHRTFGEEGVDELVDAIFEEYGEG
jgi:hypothetical protein